MLPLKPHRLESEDPAPHVRCRARASVSAAPGVPAGVAKQTPSWVAAQFMSFLGTPKLSRCSSAPRAVCALVTPSRAGNPRRAPVTVAPRAGEGPGGASLHHLCGPLCLNRFLVEEDGTRTGSFCSPSWGECPSCISFSVTHFSKFGVCF